MHIVRGLYAPLPDLETPVATLGAFDGVHRGHQRILAETVAWAADLGGQAVVLTFGEIPKSKLGESFTPVITTLEQRLDLLEACGIDIATVLPLTDELTSIEAGDFVRDLLIGWFGARHIVFGHDSTFGHGAQGNLALLRRFEANGALAVRSPEPVTWRGQVISSTAIRQAVRTGDLDAAAHMLGRPFAVCGLVARGDGRGRSLGFPTANLCLPDQLLPPDGVYAADLWARGRTCPAMAYLGRRPTFPDAEAQPSLEVHAIDTTLDLYGQKVEVRFLRRLRGDQRFPSADALIAQMRADREAALAVCGTASSRGEPRE